MTDRSGGTAAEDAASLLRGAAAGLIAGLLASFAMDRFQAAVAALSSPDDDSEPATDKTANAISMALVGHELAGPDKPLGGQWIHYGLGAGLGLMYASPPNIAKPSPKAMGPYTRSASPQFSMKRSFPLWTWRNHLRPTADTIDLSTTV